MKNKKRLLFRLLVLGVLLAAILYSIFYSLEDKSTKDMIGEQGPDFVGKTIKGEDFQLSNSLGNKTLVNFWGSWCEPCKREMPLLEQYAKNRNLNIISINVGESKYVVDKFTEKYGLTFPVLIDEDSSIKRVYNIGNLPASFFLDSNGIVEGVFEGELKEEMLEDWLMR